MDAGFLEKIPAAADDRLHAYFRHLHHLPENGRILPEMPINPPDALEDAVETRPKIGWGRREEEQSDRRKSIDGF